MPDRRPLLMLIDGPSLVYRGYFALPPLTLSDGTLVNAVFGFLQIVLRGMQDVKPDYAIVSFDVGKPQFRFDAYPDYKRGRPSMPDDLRTQFPIVREIAAMMNIPIRELAGYEADDVIGTLTKQATAANVDTMIVSGDLDGLQLVDDHVRLLTTRMGVAATVIYDEARVTERYGLRPDQMLDYKALKGDTSDNIPGVPGVGEKTASSLLQQFGTLDGIYEHLDEVKGKLRDRLTEHRESAFMSREVGRIVIDLPVELDLEEARTGRYDRRAVAQRFRELEFRVADRPAAGVEHRSDRLRLAGAGHEGRPPAQPRPARRQGATGRHRRGRTSPRPALGSVRRDRARGPADRPQRRGDGRAVGVARGARDAIGLGWAVGTGRPLGRRLFGIALAGADGSSWYVPCDPSSIAIERLPRVVRPSGAAAHRPRPEAAGGDAGGRPWHRAPGPVLRHARRGLHGQPRASVADDRRHGGHAIRGDAAGSALECRHRCRGKRDVPPSRSRSGDDGVHGLGPGAGAHRGRPREPVRRGRDAAPAGPGADGARRHPDRPRGARGDARGVRRDAGRTRVPDLRARRARVQHRLTSPARDGPLRRARASVDEAHADEPLDGRIASWRSSASVTR